MNKPSPKARKPSSTLGAKARATTGAEVPKFRSEHQEREFWERTDSTLHVDWSRARRVRLPNLNARARSNLFVAFLDLRIDGVQ